MISFSSFGLTAFAFACEVLIRSCSITSRQRLRSSARRWAESRLSLLRCFPWRMAVRATYSSRRLEPERVPALSLTSSVLRLPKFGIAFSSDSERWTRSPTVWIPARLRQL